MQYPRNPAPTDLPLIEPIKERWSPVNFSDRDIEEEKMKALFEAARWTPSSRNEQPWRYVYAGKKDEGRDVLESLLDEGNAFAKKAGLLLISFSKHMFTKKEKENRHAMHDTGAANMAMLLQATSMGLITHQMGGFNVQDANDILAVPEDFIPVSMIAFGYPGDPSDLSPDLEEKQHKSRIRNPVQDFAFRGRWNSAI